MKKLSFFTFFTLFAAISLWGQNGASYVTKITVEARNNLIRLTWTDSPTAQGPVYIFRSARPFTGSVPLNIRPVVVRYGVQSYIDEKDDLDSLYYFIAASDTFGRRYDIIVPNVNSVFVNLSDTRDADTDSSVVITLPEPPPIEGISNIKTSVEGDKVTVSYSNTNPQRKTILYRSARPIRRTGDLLNAIIIPDFTDYPVPDVAAYYAIIYEDEVSSGNIKIEPGVNTTLTALIISSDQAKTRPMRPIPLPELTLSDSVGGFLTNQVTPQPLSNDTASVIRNTPIPKREQPEKKLPRVFTVDLREPATGEESALYQIIKEYFEKFDWENANTALRFFLSLPRSKDVEARARFYLGQTHYFTGNYRNALMEFLSFRSYHEIEANIWIDSTLTLMVH